MKASARTVMPRSPETKRKVSAFSCVSGFLQLIGCYKMAPRLIPNRLFPGRPAAASNGSVQAFSQRTGPRRLWMSRELKPTRSRAQCRSFWLWWKNSSERQIFRRDRDPSISASSVSLLAYGVARLRSQCRGLFRAGAKSRGDGQETH